MKTSKRTLNTLGIGLVALAASACSAESPGDDTRADGPQGQAQAATTVARETLAAFEVGGARVEFVQLTTPDGHAELGVEESAPSTFGSTPVTRLLAEHSLTALEVFRTLAPKEMAVPSPLSSSHRAEAQLLGRNDPDAIQSVVFEANAPIEKSIAACEAWVFPATTSTGFTNKQSLNNTSGDQWLQVGSSWSYRTTSQVTLGLCNESNATVNREISWDMDGDTQSWFYSGLFASPPNTQWRWFPFSRNITGPCSGLVCPVFATRYGVHGVGAAGKLYHLKTAEVVNIIR